MRCTSSICRSRAWAGEIRIRHHACGLNFIDVYQRSGVYQLPMPLSLGMEAAVWSKRWARVTHLKAATRRYASNPPGAYTTLRVMPAKCVVKLPRRDLVRDRCGDDAQGA